VELVMKAWTAAVRMICRNGETLFTNFVVAPSRNEALAQATAQALRDPNHQACGATIAGCHASEVAPDLLRAALEGLGLD
jgi:hypothetical protein